MSLLQMGLTFIFRSRGAGFDAQHFFICSFFMITVVQTIHCENCLHINQ